MSKPVQIETELDVELIDRFFAEARSTGLGEAKGLSFSEDEMYRIASEIGLMQSFLRKFRDFSQDEDLKNYIIFLFQKLSDMELRESERCVENIRTIDLYGGRISGGAIAGGLGAVLYGAVALGSVAIAGPAALAAFGLLGTGACIWGRSVLSRDKRRADHRSTDYSYLVAEMIKIRDENKGAKK